LEFRRVLFRSEQSTPRYPSFGRERHPYRAYATTLGADIGCEIKSDRLIGGNQMDTIKQLENEIEALQESISCGADGWETIVLLHDQLIQCLKLHAKLKELL